jgi:hypothetical protein
MTRTDLATASPNQFRFTDKWEMSRLTGLSPETLKKYRLNGFLIENIHWIRLNQRTVRYCVPLVLDRIQNQHFPQVHDKAIEYCQSLLPSYQEKPKRR